MTLPAILYLDKFGRRPALLAGSFLMATWLFTTGALQASYGNPNPDPNDKDISWVVPRQRASVSKAIVACSYLFVASFATTWGPCSWTYPSEIFPAKVRAKAVSLATAANWTWNCILAFAVPPLLWSINWKMYMVRTFPCESSSIGTDSKPDLWHLQRPCFYPHVPMCTRDKGQNTRGDGRCV